ncbi:MAG: ABC transporter substrate-binding protein [Burkholderiales bacterium]
MFEPVDSPSYSCRSTRRAFILAAAAWPALFWTEAPLAQTKQPILIGWLSLVSRDSGAHTLAELKEGLAALGWKEGSQVVIEERWANGARERLQPLAQELAAKKPALIVASALTSAIEAVKGAPNVPIVMASGGDPVAAGLAKSLARPGGMVTGVTSLTINVTEKYLELLLAAAPKLKRVGFLTDSRIGARALRIEAARRSVARHAVEARFAEAAGLEDIEQAISRLAKDGAQGLVVIGNFWIERRHIVKLALAQRWPVIAGNRETVEDGALLGYSSVQSENYRRTAYYVDRILKGAKPGDLPIEQPTRFELVINLKTARALKLEISRELAVRADSVVE